MEFVDTHAHIYSHKFDDDPGVFSRSFEAGVQRIYMPNVDAASIDRMLKVESEYPGKCFAMMGIHPCSVDAGFEHELRVAEDWFSRRDFVAVGEIGIDLYWDKTYFEQQQEAFKIQCQWAMERKLPVVIHCRESMEETIGLVESLENEHLTGVFHCFTGSVEQARRILDLGFFLGIGGVSTFKNSGLDSVLAAVGIERVVLETDAPYLAPVPHRGKRNEPSYIPLIAARVAEVTGESPEGVAQLTTRNANSLFRYQPS